MVNTTNRLDLLPDDILEHIMSFLALSPPPYFKSYEDICLAQSLVHKNTNELKQMCRQEGVKQSRYNKCNKLTMKTNLLLGQVGFLKVDLGRFPVTEIIQSPIAFRHKSHFHSLIIGYGDLLDFCKYYYKQANPKNYSKGKLTQVSILNIKEKFHDYGYYHKIRETPLEEMFYENHGNQAINYRQVIDQIVETYKNDIYQEIVRLQKLHLNEVAKKNNMTQLEVQYYLY